MYDKPHVSFEYDYNISIKNYPDLRYYSHGNQFSDTTRFRTLLAIYIFAVWKKRPLDFFYVFSILSRMIFPLQKLIEYDGNIYEITCVATRRAEQLASLQASGEIESKVKIVSEAAKEIFTEEVAYQITQDNA